MMMICSFLSSILAFVVAVVVVPTALSCEVNADHEGDLVRKLPGLNMPLPSPIFSGFLSYKLQDRMVHTHYVLVLAEDDWQHDKPLIYWSNGGPGASSLFGLLTELGPLLLNDDSLKTADYAKTGIPTPLYNPNGWTRLGSLLVFDQPAPVGFSYCDNDIHSTSCLSWTDELASENAYEAFKAFFDKFPCMVGKDLYLTGESYAGIYIPTLARRILENTVENDGNLHDKCINLKGIAVGDGCLGTKTGICGDLSEQGGFDFWHILFLFGHGQIPMHSFQQVMRTCRPAEEDNWHYLRGTNAECQKALQQVEEEVGGVYGYNLYDECTYENGLLSGALNDYSCGGDLVMQKWLGLEQVQKALHVPDNFFSVDNANNFDYTPTEPDLRGFYKDLAVQNKEDPRGEVRILIYNGDTDPAITSMASQNWTHNLLLPELEPWRPWTVDGCRRMGGYVTRYEGGLDYVTIRGAGHMVPTYKAEATFAFMSAFIENKDYAMYVKDCSSPWAQKETTSDDGISLTKEEVSFGNAADLGYIALQ